MLRRVWCLTVIISFILSCKQARNDEQPISSPAVHPDSLIANGSIVKKDTPGLVVNKMVIHTGNIQPGQVVDFAKTLIGTKYRYGSTDPAVGFDCSGFITYVFNHFN